MFEFLSLVGPVKAVSAANITIRLLERRGDVFIDEVGERFSEDWSSEETQLALRALTEIEHTAKMPLRNLSEELSNEYVLALAQIATDSTGKVLSFLELRLARKILEAWKNEKPANDSQLSKQVAKPPYSSRKATSSAYRVLKNSRELDRFREMSEDELRQEAARLREALFRLNFKLALGEVDVIKRIRQNEQSLKRINTIMKTRVTEDRPN